LKLVRSPVASLVICIKHGGPLQLFWQAASSYEVEAEGFSVGGNSKKALTRVLCYNTVFNDKGD
jgi:hypothetical protein